MFCRWQTLWPSALLQVGWGHWWATALAHPHPCFLAYMHIASDSVTVTVRVNWLWVYCLSPCWRLYFPKLAISIYILSHMIFHNVTDMPPLSSGIHISCLWILGDQWLWWKWCSGISEAVMEDDKASVWSSWDTQPPWCEGAQWPQERLCVWSGHHSPGGGQLIASIDHQIMMSRISPWEAPASELPHGKQMEQRWAVLTNFCQDYRSIGKISILVLSLGGLHIAVDAWESSPSTVGYPNHA